MGEELKSISLCLLDDVNVSGCLKLGEFEICSYQAADLQVLLGAAETGSLTSEVSDRLKAYAEFPWARFEQPLHLGQVKTSFERCLQQHQLSYAHAGARSWYPFDDLLRTLNLLKPAGGPVMGRQFYSWLEPLAESGRHIDRVIYGEPLWDYNEPDGEGIHPLALEYDLEPSDTEQFSRLRKQLARSLASDSKPDNTHLRTAIHYFENADRKIVPHPLSGSFDAIEPLMSYEAALEALLVLERENGGDILSKRVAVLAKEANGVTNDKAREIENFVQRVFWLRSKIAHGVRPITEIEDLIVHKPNDKIVDNERGKPKLIEAGDYANLLLRDALSFPGFLVNLRELTRICICFFCKGLSRGRGKNETIDLLKNAH